MNTETETTDFHIIHILDLELRWKLPCKQNINQNRNYWDQTKTKLKARISNEWILGRWKADDTYRKIKTTAWLLWLPVLSRIINITLPAEV